MKHLSLGELPECHWQAGMETGWPWLVQIPSEAILGVTQLQFRMRRMDLATEI